MAAVAMNAAAAEAHEPEEWKMDKRQDLPTDSTETSAVEEALANFFGTAQDVVARYTHCALCGANLHFSHVTDFAKNLTQETAKCPECGIKIRQVLHRLQ